MANEKQPLSSSSIGTKLRAYFIAGVLVTAPITITVWLTIAIINFIDKTVKNIILPDGYYDGIFTFLSIPGVGIVIAILFLLIVGMFATNIMGRFFLRIGESILDHLPVVRSLYGATKQIFETVFANQSEAFREVVMVEYPRTNMWVIGFLTGRTRGEVQQKTADDLVNIFVPTTPNPTSGFLLFVPEKDVIHLDMTVEEGIKLVVSAGIVTPD
tara:strand:- start:62 stop:703 length:642 start_codon:yes stop_codon:yes gene_type:complete